MKLIFGLLVLGGVGYLLFQPSKIDSEKEKAPTTASSATASPAAPATAAVAQSQPAKSVTAASPTPTKFKSKLGQGMLDMKPKKH